VHGRRFIDVDPRTTGRSTRSDSRIFIERECEWGNGALRNRPGRGRRVKAVVPVDILGSSVAISIRSPSSLAHVSSSSWRNAGPKELGALYKGRPVGQGADVVRV